MTQQATQATPDLPSNVYSFDQKETTDRNVGFLINDVARLLRTNYDRSMKEMGLTRSQWWVLTHLYFQQGISQTALSSLLEIERATLGRLLDRLEDKGQVERRSDPHDRRVKRVYLSGEVEALMQDMRRKAAEIRAIALTGMSPEEQNRFIDTLIQVKANLLAISNEGLESALQSGPARTARHV